MSLRNAINSNSAAATAGAVVLLLVALGVFVWTQSGHGHAPLDAVYYYDLGADELFLGEPGQHPPVDAPSGQPGVRAHVFACGPCPSRDELLGKSWEEVEASSNAYIAHFERLTDEAREALLAGDDVQSERVYMLQREGRILRGPDQPRWVAAQSAAGQQLQRDAIMRCPRDQSAQPCHPTP